MTHSDFLQESGYFCIDSFGAPANHKNRRSFLRRLVVIKKVAGGYKVLSEKGKNLGGPYKTKKEAQKRLKQVEFFKHHK
jgi:hypothetical protein